MSPEFSAFLAVIGILRGGDPLTGTWSIGGKYSDGIIGGLLTSPKGISNSHNTYENDASMTRVSLCIHVFGG
jgi:hypothetical protein